ncbi:MULTISPECIES: hypothetical protein [unclassified Embleya]|uniref:hypothetical protein n=1 Tax=unclassified Embleya TaxID=2699296 RepID=UPI0036AC3BBD
MSRHVIHRAAALAVALGVVAVPAAAAAPLTGSAPALGRGSAEVFRRPIPPPLPSPPSSSGPLRPGLRLPGTDAIPSDSCLDPTPSGPPDADGAGLPGTSLRRDRTRDLGTAALRAHCPGLPEADRGAEPAVSPGAAGRSEHDRAGVGPRRHRADGRPPAAPGKPSQRRKPPGARDDAAEERGAAAAKRAVHDGPALIARRAITDRVANTGSAPLLPLGLAAGVLLLVGGLALVAGRRRDRPGRDRPRRD